MTRFLNEKLVYKSMKVIDPWGSGLVEDYEKIIKDFGLERFDPKLFPNPNRIMRRGEVFAGRDLKRIADCIKNKKPFYALTGIMPTSPQIHFGTKLVVENLKYFQEHGAHTFILIADLEAAAARGVSLEEAQQRALEFHIPAYIALGLDPKKTTFYFQSENMEVVRIGYRASTKITLNEFRASYGSAEPGRIMSAVTQIGDMLFPQLAERMPGIIPVGIDQEPHIRLCRDFINRSKSEKFFPISSIYHKYTPSLDGGLKMSKSKPESCVSLPEDLKAVKKKINRAKSGGRVTMEEQRKLGAIIEDDMPYQLLKQHFIEDDKELMKIHDDYKSGKLLTGEVKKITYEKFESFMNKFNKDIEKARKIIPKLKFIRYTKN